MILTLTGASGAGKTSVAKRLLKEFPIYAQMVPSYTIRKFRKPRPSDIPGEYKHVSRFCFWFLKKNGAFLWTVYPHGNSYGTTKHWVTKALKEDDTVYIMILTPDAVKKLKNFAKETGYSDKVFCVFILSLPREILRKRLKLRGDKEDEIEKRLVNCVEWDSNAMASGIPYEFVKNNDTIEAVTQEVIARFLKKIGSCDCYF